MAEDPRAGRRRLADRAQAPLRGARGATPSSRSSARPTTASAPSSCASELRPDVVTLDMMLPVMSGLAATEYIMAHCPTPILIVSASTNRGELFKTYEALAAGAVDVLEKPQRRRGRRRVGAALPRDGEAGRANPGHHPRARSRRGCARPELACRRVRRATPRGAPTWSRSARRPAGPARSSRCCARCRRSSRSRSSSCSTSAQPSARRSPTGSTGRPGVASRTRATASRSPSAAGRVVMAPPDQHLVVQAGRFRLTRDPERHSCRPSVDVLFESVATRVRRGRGGVPPDRHGARRRGGLLADPPRGRAHIAQDEATSVVYGMPREAVLLGAAERVLPLDGIARAHRHARPADARRGSP